MDEANVVSSKINEAIMSTNIIPNEASEPTDEDAVDTAVTPTY